MDDCAGDYMDQLRPGIDKEIERLALELRDRYPAIIDHVMQLFEKLDRFERGEKVNDHMMRSGWECPRCHVVNAPHVDQCKCSYIICQLQPYTGMGGSVESNPEPYPYDGKASNYPIEHPYANVFWTVINPNVNSNPGDGV